MMEGISRQVSKYAKSPELYTVIKEAAMGDFNKFITILDSAENIRYSLYAALLSMKDYKQQIKPSNKYRLFNFYGQNNKYDTSNQKSQIW